MPHLNTLEDQADKFFFRVRERETWIFAAPTCALIGCFPHMPDWG